MSEHRDGEPNLLDPSEFMRLAGLRLDEFGPTRVLGHLDAGPAHHQPWGLVHGGLYASVIETAATIGAYVAVRDRGQIAVGVTNSSNFLRPHAEGRLLVEARAIHQGRTSQLWEVLIRRAADGAPVASGSVRLHNLEHLGSELGKSEIVEGNGLTSLCLEGVTDARVGVGNPLGVIGDGASFQWGGAKTSSQGSAQRCGLRRREEALAELSCETAANGLRAPTRREQLAAARTCYDHLAGRLGVSIADAALAAGALREDFSLSDSASAWFKRLGVDLEAPSPGRRPLLRVCTDWTERREHLAGTLGAAVCTAVLTAGWAVRRPTSRALSVTLEGEAQLRRLGIATDREGRN